MASRAGQRTNALRETISYGWQNIGGRNTGQSGFDALEARAGRRGQHATADAGRRPRSLPRQVERCRRGIRQRDGEGPGQRFGFPGRIPHDLMFDRRIRAKRRPERRARAPATARPPRPTTTPKSGSGSTKLPDRTPSRRGPENPIREVVRRRRRRAQVERPVARPRSAWRSRRSARRTTHGPPARPGTGAPGCHARRAVRSKAVRSRGNRQSS